MEQVATLKTLLEELLMLFHESAGYHCDLDDVRSVLEEAQGVVRRLQARLQWTAREYAVALVGLSNVGKSTLVNALLGDEYAPHQNGPCTSAAMEFRYGEADSVGVTLRDPNKLRPPFWGCTNAASIRRRLEQLAASTSESGRSEVVVPAACLSTGLVLVDTPGFGAAQIQTPGSHESALREYLHANIAQVFWVVLAEQGITKREERFYHDYLVNVCDDVVVNGCEEWSDADRERFKRRFAEVFAYQLPAFHFISAKQGMRARQTNDVALWNSSGIDHLEIRLRDLGTPGQRAGMLESDLRGLAADLGVWMARRPSSAGPSLSPWWRPDSFERWLAVLPAVPVKQELTRHLKEH